MAVALDPWKTQREPDWQRRVDAMSDELRRQSAHMAAAEYRWLRLLAEFDEAEGWASGGARSTAAWLSWACGIGPEAAREKVRVARALPALTRLCESFAAGRLSYSKVRAITRVATPENEELLTTYGESATAAQLEKVLRGYRHVRRLDEAREAAKVHERCYVRHWVDDDGCIRINAKLPPEDGAFVVAEMERLAESGGDPNAAPPAPSNGDVSAETAEAGRGDAPVVSEPWEASDPSEVRLAGALRTMAEIAAANGPQSCRDGEDHLVVLHVRHEEMKSDPAYDAPVADPAVDAGTTIEGVGRVSAETARRIACDADLVVLVEDALGRPLGVGRQSAKVPRRIRRALKRRDRGRCQFPNCLMTRFLDAHHVKHWADDGPTDLDNLALLCRFHHRLVHEVGYSILMDADGAATFLRPDGSVVPASMPSPAGDPAAVQRDNRLRQLRITEETAVPDWDGKPPDYSWAVEVLRTYDTAS